MEPLIFGGFDDPLGVGPEGDRGDLLSATYYPKFSLE